MPKSYYYKNLSYPVADDTDVNFTVEFVSDGNTAYTKVNVPGTRDPGIEDEGTVFIGKGRDLRSDTTFVVSNVANLAPNEDEIRIRYLINGQLIKEHSNMKSEEQRPAIYLFIKFPEL
jgi:hypothetical protein